MREYSKSKKVENITLSFHHCSYLFVAFSALQTAHA
uniref:Uncharacterized protein n=1 Tax=Arundo donax TaxID=35708 RepID=A0A0A9HA72_ARUDO